MRSNAWDDVADDSMATARLNTAIADVQAPLVSLARERSRLAELWRSMSSPVQTAEQRIRTLEVELDKRKSALSSFRQKNGTDLGPISPVSSTGGSTRSFVGRAGESFVAASWASRRFDELLSAAGRELGATQNRTFKGGGRRRAASHVGDYLSLLRELEREHDEARRAHAQAVQARHRATAELRADAEVSLQLAIARAAVAESVLPCHLRDWTDPDWKGAWRDHLIVGGNGVRGGLLAPRPDPRLGDHAEFACDVRSPWFFPSDSNLQLVHSPEQRDAAHGLIRSALLRILLTRHPGEIRLSFFDPVGLGQSVGSLLELGEYDPELVGGKAWSSTADLKAKLAELTAHIELVVQKHLRNTYQDIDEFNREAGEVAEPYRYLVVFDFPQGFNQETFEEFAKIVQNGPRCGVRTLLATGQNFASELPYGVDPSRISSQVPSLIFGEPFPAVSEAFEYSFTTDSDMTVPHSVTHDIVDHVGRASTSKAEAVVTLKRVTELFRDAARRQVSRRIPEYASSLDLDDPSTWWAGSTKDGISGPIGRKGARDVAVLTLDSGDHSGALLVGRPGSGKSTLLHSFISSTTALYGPDELELYLIDFKEGVEFQMYASQNLPHARCVAIETDREFGLSVLQSLEEEQQRRGVLFREAGTENTNLARWRESTGLRLPRIVLVFDEFHILFSKNDRLGLAAANLLEQLIRQGRSFGIHVVLGSQSLAGLDALGSHVPQLLPVRILLPATELDARKVLAENNAAGQFLTKAGEGIFNPSAGAVEANEQFKGSFQAEDQRRFHLGRLREAADRQGFTRKPIVFQGASTIRIESVPPAEFREELQASGRAPLRIRNGRPMTIHGTADIQLAREAGANVLLVARDDSGGDVAGGSLMADSTPRSVLVTTVASLAISPARLEVFDFLPIDDGLEEDLQPFLEAGRVAAHRRRNLKPVLTEFRGIVEERLSMDDTGARPAVLLLFGLHRARDLDTEMGLDSDPELLDCLEYVLREGPEVGVHTWAWSETTSALARRLPSMALREFSWRIAGRMSADDSHSLLGTEDAAQLQGQQILISNEDRGIAKRCSPYASPTGEWLGLVLGLGN